MRKLGEAADNDRPSYPLAAMMVSEVEKAAGKWKEERPGWQALQKLLPE